MKSFVLLTAALAFGLTLATSDAEAKRLGGGKSSGMQRESVSSAPKSAPTAAPAPAAGASAAAGAAQPKRSWMGPLAGLAAGLGLAALASHFGFGEELASMLMIGLAVMAVLMVIGFIMRKRAMAQRSAGGMQYAGAGAPFGGDQPLQRQANNGGPAVPTIGSALGGGGGAATAAAPADTAPAGHIPADFDVAGFVRNAKVNFIRMQAANDAGNLDDIREFTSPEMFAEIKLDLAERGSATQETEVLVLDADVIDVAEDAMRYVVSVRFHGSIREDKGAAPSPLNEVWHLTKPRDGRTGWVVAGIQQVQ